MSISISARLFNGILKLSNFKKKVERRAQKQQKRSRKPFLPGRFERTYKINVTQCSGKTAATFEPKEAVSNTHVVFFHGGAYIFEAGLPHWMFAEKIVKKTACRMTLIDYPLAPESTYLDTFEMVAQAYEGLVETYPLDQFVFLGDSAGGGLCLAFSQKLSLEKHKKLPYKMILLSPWLDLSMANPEIRKYESRDHILSVNMLQYAASKYAADTDLSHYWLSPINGELQNLPETLLFFGTEEIFNPDCKKFHSMGQERNLKIIAKEYEGMQHDWGIFPIAEGKRLLEEICLFINDE